MANNSQSLFIKKDVMKKLIEAYFSDDFAENTRLIPYDLRPEGSEATYRCCIHHERAIIKNRIIAGLGFPLETYNERITVATYANEANERTEISGKNLTVVQQACKGCVPSSIYVTDLCKGCVARPCEKTCKFGAITVKDGRSEVNPEKCKKCQMCISACPYHAIVKLTSPCEDVCPVGAMQKDESGRAVIDFSKCISCGKCISGCPFGAVHEKSQIIDIMRAIKSDKKVVALIAPSIAGQFEASIYQLKTAITKIGFDDVYEVAQGADITAHHEAEEFAEKIKDEGEWLDWMNEGGYGETEEAEQPKQKFMTTSCCAGYNQLIKKHIPEIKPYVSNTKTPLYYTAEIAKKNDPDCVTVFVGPCLAKRKEGFLDENVNYVMSFDELDAFFEARNIMPIECEETKYVVEASKQARNFGVTGGVAEAVKKSLKNEDSIKPYIINGLNKENIKKLKQFAKEGVCENGCNMVEVMCCEGGCIAGNATINGVNQAKKQLVKTLEISEDIEKI